jgi:putative transposase
MDRGLKMRIVLEIVEMRKSVFYYRSTRDDTFLIKKISAIAMRYTFYGYRRIYATLRRQGIMVNRKRVYRIYRMLDLQKPVKIKHGKKLQTTPPEHLTEAEYPNHVWAMDFCFRSLSNNRRVKILTIEDLYSRKGIAVHADFSMDHRKLIDVLAKCFDHYGRPAVIRSDNGGEFIADGTAAFLATCRVRGEFIPKGSPWWNGRAERFNGTLKYECLFRFEFDTLNEMRSETDDYLEFYNRERPHSALGYRPPNEIYEDRCLTLSAEKSKL